MMPQMSGEAGPAYGGKIAIAHDSLTQEGGAERVLEALHELFPDAPVYTLVLDLKLKQKYAGWDIRTSNLQTLYLALGKFQYLLPLVAYGVDTMDFSGYDLVISSSSTFIKNLRVPKQAKHICYCHTPTRFLWSDENYVKQEVPFGLRWLARVFLRKLKKWDYSGAQRVTKFIANSQEVQKRIKKYYNRDSEVVYPFVEDYFFSQSIGPKKDYFLLAGRLQPHKNNEMVVQLFNQLNLPLHVVGTGRQEEYLKSIAKNNVKFYGRISDEELKAQYQGALGYIYTQKEDFGLMPLEAAACGTATIAFGQGGALETVLPGKTGELFQNRDELKRILLNWHAGNYRPENLTAQASNFSKKNFINNLLKIVNGQ